MQTRLFGLLAVVVLPTAVAATEPLKLGRTRIEVLTGCKTGQSAVLADLSQLDCGSASLEWFERTLKGSQASNAGLPQQFATDHAKAELNRITLPNEKMSLTDPFPCELAGKKASCTFASKSGGAPTPMTVYVLAAARVDGGKLLFASCEGDVDPRISLPDVCKQVLSLTKTAAK
jgi:hypothetical protein